MADNAAIEADYTEPLGRGEAYFTIRLWAYEDGPDDVRVYGRAMPNTDELVFTFWKLDFEGWERRERLCVKTVEFHRMDEQSFYDQEAIRLFFFKYQFRSWNLPLPMSRGDDGGLDRESLGRLLALHPAILRALAVHADADALSSEDEEKIGRQCATLFANNSGGVTGPHPMVSLYCTLTEMWDKFGLNYFDLKRLPINERTALRMIARLENQIRSAELRKEQSQAKGRQGRPMIPMQGRRF